MTTERVNKLLKMLEMDPADTFCLYAIAQEYAKADDHASAVEYYDRTIAVDEDYLYAYFHKARSLDELGRHDEVAPTLEMGLARARALNDAKAASEFEEYLAST